MMLDRIALSFGLAACVAGHVTCAAAQQSTLETVKERGHLNCMVGPALLGFYELGDDGTWSGMDVDVCRGIAAAIFADPDKVEYQPVSPAIRFTALVNGESDLISRTTTWTFSRDTTLGVDFTAVDFYDGTSFMVPSDRGITSSAQLDGATICIGTGTTAALTTADFFAKHNMQYSPLMFEDMNVVVESYVNGACDSMLGDKAFLAARRATFPDPSAHVILPETLSKEPLAQAVRNGDNQWGDIVRWTFYAMIAAEERGLTSDNVDEMRSTSEDPEIRRLLGVEGNLGEGLGLDDAWAYNVVKMVGNYGEIYDRNVGAGTVVNIPRAGTPNALWSEGGLMYAPPIR